MKTRLFWSGWDVCDVLWKVSREQHFISIKSTQDSPSLLSECHLFNSLGIIVAKESCPWQCMWPFTQCGPCSHVPILRPDLQKAVWRIGGNWNPVAARSRSAALPDSTHTQENQAHGYAHTPVLGSREQDSWCSQLPLLLPNLRSQDVLKKSSLTSLPQEAN